MIDPVALQMVLCVLTGWLDRREREVITYLIEEDRLLRRQLGNRRLRLTDDDRRRLAARAYRVGRAALREIATIATPDTLLRWHRQLIARKWTYGRRTGRRGVLLEIQRLVERMAEENPTSGYTRIQGAHDTVFVIDLASRRVHVLGSTPHPTELFMGQMVRFVTAADDGVLVGHRALICDRDRKWSGAVRQQLGDAGIRVVLTPERAPNANAYAERFVRSIKEECLDRMIPLGERHFQARSRGICRSLPLRTESSRSRQRADCGDSGPRRRRPNISTFATGRTA